MLSILSIGLQTLYSSWLLVGFQAPSHSLSLSKNLLANFSFMVNLLGLKLLWSSSGVSSHSPQSQNREKSSLQRKTTLKWGSDGELSSIDMTRILGKLAETELTECDLDCNLDESD